MKLLFAYAWMLIVTCLACQEKDDLLILAIDGESSTYLFNAEGGNETVKISANVTWGASVASPGNEWCQVAKRNKNELALTIKPNLDQTSRETIVTISADKAQPVELTVRQAGSAPDILFSSDTCRVMFAGGIVRVGVVASVDYEVRVDPAWITHLDKEADEELFSLETNNSRNSRTGSVLFQQVGGGVEKNLTFVQAGRDTIYSPGNASDVAGDIKLKVSSSTAPDFQGGEEIERSYDGDFTTLYHSSWNNTHFPVTLTYKFENISQMDYMVYHPRSDGGSNGNFKELKVSVKANGQSVYTQIGGIFNFNGSGTASMISFSPPLSNPTEIKIEVLSGTTDLVSCAEMEFYRRNETSDFSAIFTDKTCSELKPGVTLEQINAINNAFVRNLAIYMFNGDYSRDFRVQEYSPLPSPESVAQANKTKKYSLLDNATGISIGQAGDIIVFVGDLHGQNVALRVMDFSNGYTGSSYPLLEGMNKIKVTNKGLAYIMYHTSDPAAQPVKIHIPSGQVNGYFDVTKHTSADWQRLLGKAVNQQFDVLGRKAHLVFPVARYKSHCPNIVPVIEAYDQIVGWEQEFIGFEKYGRTPKNRVMLLVSYNPDTFMSATDYRTNYNDNTLAELLNVQLLKTTAVWGPAHEIGHIHQTSPGMSWVGLGEVSNNIYSLYVQTSFGNTSRLLAEKQYQRGFNDIIVAKIPFGALSTDPYFQRLSPFWQLQMYAVAIGRPDFYKDLHEQVRVNPDKNYNTQCGEIQLDFVRYACNLLETDLTHFFETWGILKEINQVVGDYSSVQQTITTAQINTLKAEIAAKPYGANKAPAGLPYLTENTIDALINHRNIVPGTCSKSGQNISMQGWSNVMAFEVYSNGNVVWATPDHNFTTSVPNATFKAVAWDGTRVDMP